MIKLALSDSEGRLLWCRAQRARRLMRKAVIDQNMGELAFGFGWLDQILDDLMMAAPDELRPEGNETNKP